MQSYAEHHCIRHNGKKEQMRVQKGSHEPKQVYELLYYFVPISGYSPTFCFQYCLVLEKIFRLGICPNTFKIIW